MILQDLRRAKLTWDEKLPNSMEQRWIAFRDDVSKVESINIPRWFKCNRDDQLTLHAFADASRRAFAMALYVRPLPATEKSPVHLVAAKTKLASLKSLMPPKETAIRMTIPRLELRAALLNARLLRSQADALEVSLKYCYAWSDSQVVLHWIHSDEPVGNDFVDNYVSHIHEILPGVKWSYVPSKDNPADRGTRGSSAPNLIKDTQWSKGHDWLSYPADCWIKNTATHRHVDLTNSENYPVLNCLAYYCGGPLPTLRKVHSPDSPAPLGTLTHIELQQAFLACVKLSQAQCFEHEIRRLKLGDTVENGSPLRRLDPYLDENGVLRIGGRLLNSLLSDEEKNPPVLSRRSHLAQLVIDWAHKKALHSGFQLTFAHMMKRAWIIGGKVQVKGYVRRCVLCTKDRARPRPQMMSSLPTARVTPARPFSKTGVDYAGPFQVLSARGRGVRSTKGYVSVFVCMATKAIHLELVGDLTTQSFLGALTRFVNRRGKPREMLSDNATNFHGADLELRRLLREANLDWNQVEGSMALDGIDWRFIPPAAPHFGGIWEAGVKSLKTHLRRVAGPRKLTYEEFSTLLTEIEAVLNNRPLLPLTNENDDLDVLTPAHFLIGCASTTLPRPSTDCDKMDLLQHWKLVQGLRDQFWLQWSRDYLNTLQQRSKWTRPLQNLQVGDFVIIVDPTLIKATGKWPMGRIVAVHPGQDGLVRVADVKTSDHVYSRPVVKLVGLPVTNSAE